VLESRSKYRVFQRRSRFGVASATLCILVAATSSCTGYEPASDTLPSVVTSGASATAVSSDDWSCVNQGERVLAPPVSADTAGRVIYSIQVVDLSTGQLHPDARVRACGYADVNCEQPVTNSLMVDANGWVDLPLFRGFTGFLEVTSSTSVPDLFYLAEPVQESTVEYPLAVVSLENLGLLVQLLGVPFEPNTGVIAARAFNCSGDPASGVALSADNDSVQWYFVDGLPASSGSGTGADGMAGIVNVQPGVQIFDLKANGVSIAGPQSVVVRPNWLSAVYVRPPGGVRPFTR
jgi:hypothetical protein